MSINDIITSAITPIVPECAAHVYDEKATEYCTFNFTTWPDCFVDNKPTQIGYSIQVHYCLPMDNDPSEKLKKLSNALLAAGLDYPNIVDASDDVGQHYVLETGWHEART